MSAKYRVVVAGCGGMANTWVDYAKNRPDTEIVGLVDIRLEAAAAMKERQRLGECGIYDNVEAAIDAEKPDIVFDATIPASHYNVGMAALTRGCHVFAEKPLAESMGDCLHLVELSREYGKTHAVMQNRRYDARIRALRTLIDDGTIGKTGYVSADFFLGAHFGGFRDAMDSPLLLDMAIHTFDQARLITGANPVSVYCHEFNPPGSWYAGNAMAVCIFEMSDGTVFKYSGSWCAEGAPTSWEANWRITGEKGTALWDGDSVPYAEVVIPSEDNKRFHRECVRVEAALPELSGAGHVGCLNEMFAALEEGRKPETDCSDNIYSMAMVLASLASAREGRKIFIEDFLKQHARS